jgi:hypothetical protein
MNLYSEKNIARSPNRNSILGVGVQSELGIGTECK